jgi:hypothetical protein
MSRRRFQPLEKQAWEFPMIGKSGCFFSNGWNFFRAFFQWLEIRWAHLTSDGRALMESVG